MELINEKKLLLQHTSHPGDSTEYGSGAHHSVQSRRDTVVTRDTLATEHPDVGVLGGQLLHEDTHYPTHNTSHAQAGDEQSTGHLETFTLTA